jgi:hypothetical protein
VVYAASVGSSDGKIWNVTIKVGGADAVEAVDKQFADAGYRQDMDNKTDKGGTASFTKEPYSVLVVIAKDSSSGWVANYTVTQKK